MSGPKPDTPRNPYDGSTLIDRASGAYADEMLLPDLEKVLIQVEQLHSDHFADPLWYHDGFTAEQMDALRELVAPWVLSQEIEALLSTRRPLAVDGRHDFGACVREYESLLTEARQPSTSVPNASWLPLGFNDSECIYAVMGERPTDRSTIAIWHTKSLVVSAPFPSARTLMLAYAEMLRQCLDRGLDLEGNVKYLWEILVDPTDGTSEYHPAVVNDLARTLHQPFDDLARSETESPGWPSGTGSMRWTDMLRPVPSPWDVALRSTELRAVLDEHKEQRRRRRDDRRPQSDSV